MKESRVLKFIEEVLENMPKDWVKLTTHRLDIYDEQLAKTQFLDRFDDLYKANNSEPSALSELPTAFDYIRLGHPLSCVLEWAIAQINERDPAGVISFDSKTIPVMAILRKNFMAGKATRIYYTGSLPDAFDFDALKRVYGYNFELIEVESADDVPEHDSAVVSSIFVSESEGMGDFELTRSIDFLVRIYPFLGSVILVNGASNEDYISEIQHVRRRETIAMTPANCVATLRLLTGNEIVTHDNAKAEADRADVVNIIANITGTQSNALIASSGLSMQYAIMMGLVDNAHQQYPGKEIKFIVPPNCYGGTNDQARRVAACVDNVEVLDLHVDGDHDMVQSIDKVLDQVAAQDAVPYIIAEIPTNPRVEVPNLVQLKAVLSVGRKTAKGEDAIDPVFILDQTFCPNVKFLGENGVLSSVRALSYVSGSKFPSGGKCTAGYCVANEKAEALMAPIEKHLKLCDNEATGLQLEILANQMPSMNQRIDEAYKNTREFVNFIREILPEAKINFVSEELAEEGFKPSVFSLDLPTKGDTEEEREAYKRALNLKLINMMIGEIPKESKYCVSYGQLKGCYWTIPATSTQGTTKESDKDYIARVSLAPDIDLDRHKKVFSDFVRQI